MIETNKDEPNVGGCLVILIIIFTIAALAVII